MTRIATWYDLNAALTPMVKANKIVSLAGALRGQELRGKGDAAVYRWEDVNRALMALGMPAHQIVRVLFAIPK